MTEAQTDQEVFAATAAGTLQEGPLLQSALNLLPMAVIIVDVDGRIRHANSAAHAMLRLGDPLWSRQTVLHATQPGRSRVLHAAIQAAVRAARPASLEVALQFSDGRAAIAHLRLLVLPVGQARSSHAVAILVTEPRRDWMPPLAALAQLFDLTQAELRVLGQIASGRNRKQSAAALGLADSTVKTHLDNLYVKTGTSDQGELTRLVDRLSWPL